LSGGLCIFLVGGFIEQSWLACVREDSWKIMQGDCKKHLPILLHFILLMPYSFGVI